MTLYSEIEGTLVDIKPRLSKDVAGHSENLNHFIDVVQGRTEPIFTIDQGVNTLKIISALYESARTGKEIQL